MTKAEIKKSYLQSFKENIMSGTTIAFVSVPLSTALAIASACTPTMGVATSKLLMTVVIQNEHLISLTFWKL
jgi:MFS superfamily sulfate permease-like transporter